MSRQFHWERETLKLYQIKLKGRLSILEIDRKQLLQYLVFILLVVAFGVFQFVRKAKHLPIVLIVAGAVALLFSILFYNKYKKFRTVYKNKILAEMVQMIFPNSQFHPEQFISQQNFFVSQLFHSRIDRYKGEDYVEGQLNNRAFQFSELHVERKDERYEKGRRRTHWVTVFRGLFYQSKLDKPVNTPLYILPDPSEEILGRWLGRMVGQWSEIFEGRGKALELENPIFEKYYKVFCDDPILARTKLTPVAMELLVQFREVAKRPIHISLIHDQIYLAISFRHDLFEPSLFGTMVKVEELTKNLQALKVVEGLYQAIH